MKLDTERMSNVIALATHAEHKLAHLIGVVVLDYNLAIHFSVTGPNFIELLEQKIPA